MSKQSSVEFIFEKLWDTPKDKFEWNTMLQQAKAIHKEEIMDAFEFGTNNGVAHCHGHQLEKPIEYFNYTFNQ